MSPRLKDGLENEVMNSKKTDKLSIQKLSLFTFDCVMAVVYVAAGVFLLFTSTLSHIHKGMRIGMGIVFGLYGLFRVYRAYRKITQKNE